MRVLAFDPGLERVGFAVVDRVGSKLTAVEYGLIQTPRVALPTRLKLIHERACELVTQHTPDAIVTERLLFAANKTTAFDVAKALGCLLLACESSGQPWREYSPPEIKRAVVGNGRAEKSQVQLMVTRLLGLPAPPKPDDVADALAIAICDLLQAPLPRTSASSR